MSRPPKEPDAVYSCPICHQTVRIPARIRVDIPSCNGGDHHRHRWVAMKAVG